jgi:hypothetical protein
VKSVINLLLGVFLIVSPCLGADDEKELGVSLDITWVSKYLWRGFDLFDDKAAFQPSATFDLYGTGFSAQFWASYPGSSGTSTVSTVNATEYDYTIAYDFSLFESESYATSIHTNYIYYDFIDQPDKAADSQEAGVGFTWPKIFESGIVPSYYVGRIWATRSNSDLTGRCCGWIHILGLNYGLKLPGLTPDVVEQVINLSASIVYNDGFSGATVKHDWSHALFGASTDFPMGKATLRPAVYYQSSFEDSVNTEDEFFSGISFIYNF